MAEVEETDLLVGVMFMVEGGVVVVVVVVAGGEVAGMTHTPTVKSQRK